MSEMTDSERLAYGLITTAGREEEFKKRIDELVKRRQDAEAAEAKIQAEAEALEKTRADTELRVAQETEKLNTARAAHDASAEESAKRLQLAEQVKVTLAEREKALDDREHALADREAKLKADATSVMQKGEELRTRLAETEKLQTSLHEKHEKLREILS
jgi:chromosome segregation ATPase